MNEKSSGTGPALRPLVFDAPILRSGNIDAAYVEFPFNVMELFGVRGQVKVKVVFDHKITYSGSLANMGKGCHTLGITKAIRKELGKEFGQMIHVELEQDTGPREVLIPEDVAILLAENPTPAVFFNSLSYTNQKEYIVWIESAKKIETRNRRLLAFIENLHSHKKLTDK